MDRTIIRLITTVLTIISFGVSLLSCSNEDIKIPTDKDSSAHLLSNGAPANLNLIVEELSSVGDLSISTKSEPTLAETKILNIWILQFDGAVGSSQLLSRQYASNESIRTVYIVPNDSTNRIVILANIYSSDDLKNLSVKDTVTKTSGITYDSFKSMTFPTKNLLDNISLKGAIPMCGEVIIEHPDERETTEIKVKLTRTVAKISLNIKSDLSDYELDSVFVCNVPTSTYYYPDFQPNATYPPTSVSRTNYYLHTQHSKSIASVDASYSETVFYVPVNIQDSIDNNNLDSEAKRRLYAPSDATFITIRGHANSGDLQKNGGLIYYHKYIGANQTSDYNVLPNHCYTYNYNIVGSDPSGTNSNIEKSEIRNCYIMVPTKEDEADRTVTIDVAEMVNRYWKQESDKVHPNDVLEMVNIWSEGETSDGYVAPALSDLTFSKQSGTTKFSTVIPRNTYGNYFVAVKKNGKTLWSYHIWCPKSSPERVTALPSGAKIMRRNLGAIWDAVDVWEWGSVSDRGVDKEYYRGISMGLFYQWGRKDPFRTFNTPIHVTNSSCSISESVENPSTYYYLNNANWCSSSDDDLWSNTKTIYDPCPKGWKVPDNSSYNNISSIATNQYGKVWPFGYFYYTIKVLNSDDALSPNYGDGETDINYLPIPGRILNGQIDDRDDYKDTESIKGLGVYWTSTNGSFLYVDKDNIGTSIAGKSYPKSTGASIRCQKM